VAAIASAAMRNSQALPSERRTASSSRGSTCGRITRRMSSQLEALSVCALMICSTGSSRTRCCRSRMMNGVMPMTISTTLETSPSPNTMNRIGSAAMGGIIASAATKGARLARR
jgi:hypothetical protein